MATTSIWSVKGWLGKVVIYVGNPEKTMNPENAKLPDLSGMEESNNQSLSDVIAYAVNEEKTRRKNKGGRDVEDSSAEIDDEHEKVMQQYVSGVNCTPTTARSVMMAVKKRYGKDEGIMAFHGYQSFAPGECTPAMAHEIGVRLAEELWGSRFQVLVATHLDKAHHLHNHFVVNSVSYADGKRYYRTNQDYRDMRNASDRLCQEYELSVIEHPEKGKARHYAEWKAEQEGKPTYHSMVRADVDEAIAKARTEKQFFHYLKMQESGGRGLDPMQSSEGGFNTRYPRKPNGITDPEYSIQCGVQELKFCLVSAGVENPLDMQNIKLALQRYNFGNGYISWAKSNYGGYTAANAAEFSDMMAQRMGWSGYGDKQYVPHVLQYYVFGGIPTGTGSGAIVAVALTQEGNAGDTYWSWYGFSGRVEWCACFASWCADQCGYIDSGVIPRFSLCSDGVDWFSARGRFQDGSYV